MPPPLVWSGETLDDVRRLFMSSVDEQPSGCWLWRGEANAYGTFRGRPAHRASWEIFQGPIEPKGLAILHGCNLVGSDKPNRGCVNPAHLRPGTDRDNVLDHVRVAQRQRALELAQTPLAFLSVAGAETIIEIARARRMTAVDVRSELAKRLHDLGLELLDTMEREAGICGNDELGLPDCYAAEYAP
jgi:hypothetical protein